MQRVTVAARAGLAGNPSDAYGGAAVAVPVPALAATVEVVDTPAFRVVGNPDGAVLVTAAVARLARRAGVDERGFELRWSTTIPRSVGLAGSSAIVIGTLRAAAARWGVTLAPQELARMALAVEVEDVGIAAGLMDRAVQALGVPVLVDGDEARPLRVPDDPPSVVVAWRASAAQSSHAVHGPLRARFDAGDHVVVEAMAELAELGREAAQAIEGGDRESLAGCVRATFLRRLALGIVGPDTLDLVTGLEVAGLAATSAGSGGSAVGVLPPGMSADRARALLAGRSDGIVTAELFT